MSGKRLAENKTWHKLNNLLTYYNTQLIVEVYLLGMTLNIQINLNQIMAKELQETMMQVQVQIV